MGRGDRDRRQAATADVTGEVAASESMRPSTHSQSQARAPPAPAPAPAAPCSCRECVTACTDKDCVPGQVKANTGSHKSRSSRRETTRTKAKPANKQPRDALPAPKHDKTLTVDAQRRERQGPRPEGFAPPLRAASTVSLRELLTSDSDDDDETTMTTTSSASYGKHESDMLDTEKGDYQLMEPETTEIPPFVWSEHRQQLTVCILVVIIIIFVVFITVGKEWFVVAHSTKTHIERNLLLRGADIVSGR
eukprot:GFYU01003425.1.p1 GENE.GFYU01003425.1~~GFYU01003425.1.p1  ORF type:complete len:249 (+),score=30.98 GFYU01003425.1:110-856(+)